MGALRICCYKTYSLNLDATLGGKNKELISANRAQRSGARQQERKQACERVFHEAGLAAINGRGREGKGATAGKQNDGSDRSEAREKNKTNITYGSEWQEFQREVFLCTCGANTLTLLCRLAILLSWQLHTSVQQPVLSALPRPP